MIIDSQFRACWWLKNKHLQTLWPVFFRRRPQMELTQETLHLEDGDFLDLSWTKKTGSSPVVVILHGLEGSMYSHYASGMLDKIEQLGWQGVLMHFRGCGGRHNKLDRSYHSGETNDLRYFIDHLAKNFPDRDIVIIGYSLGGNVLLKYLGEENNNSIIKAAVAVSVPFELANGAKRLNSGFSKIYQHYLISKLTRKMRDKFKQRQAPFDLTNISNWNNFYSFDHNVTARLHGFTSADEYYKLSSCRRFIKDITSPTLIIHSQDDPFLTPDAIPAEEELSAQVTLELCENGGHVGFISGATPWGTHYWLEDRIISFLKRKIKPVKYRS